MKLFANLSHRLRLLNLPGAVLMMLLQRTPLVSLVATTGEMVIASPMGTLLKAVVATASALGAVNTMVGATPLVPSTGTATGISVATGSPVSVFYTVNGTQTPPMSWHVSGNFPPGLDFSGLTSTGSVNVGSLHLSGTPSTAGTFNVTLQTFEFTNEGGIPSPSYSYTITVTGSSSNTAPTFTTQPASQSVTAGAAVTFTAAASGTPAPTFQWKKDNVDIAGATNASFSIASAATGDAGSYTVIATNSAGTITSNAATLTISAASSAPVFTAQPANQTVAPGSAVSFSATATGSPTPTFQWKKDNVNITGATNASYSIASATNADAGSYTVVASNSAGSATSNAASLTVSATTSAPVFTTQPSSQSVAPGTAVSFTAAATGSPTPTFQWQKGNVNIAGATNASYSIASASTNDAGSYTVIATNSAGSVTSTAATLTVSAAAVAPAFTTQPASQSVTVGSSVTFTAAATGSPTPTYQWQKGGTNIAGATAATLSINSTTQADAGNYAVVASNSAGSVTSTSVSLTLLASRLASQTVTLGHGTSFSAVNAVGTIQWQVSSNNGTTWTNVTDNSTYSGATTSSLIITNAASSLNGAKYRYTATSAAGSSTSNAVVLTVEPALLPFPTGIAADSAGNIYVSDANSDTIQKINPSGQVSLIAGATGTTGSADGTGSSARFNQPNGVVLASAGILFVSDASNATIRRIATDGNVTTFAGTAGSKGNTDGTGAAAMFALPSGITIDPNGTLFVADAMNHTIRKIAATGAVTTFAGSAGATGSTDGNGPAARFNFPTGIASDPSGNIYVADTTNNTIRKITPAGDVSTLAGVQGISGFQDGTGGEALFNHPSGLTVDTNGNLYVADTGNSTIRKITSGGAVTTLAGLPGVAGLNDGVGGDALFNQPQILVAIASGGLVVADTGNAAIRKIDASGSVTTLTLAAASAPTPTPDPVPTNPAPSPSPSSSGGGGGSTSGWVVGALSLLVTSKCLRKKFPHAALRRSSTL